MEDVYQRLLSKKLAHESFSDVIRRELDRKRDITEFVGAWNDVPGDSIDEMQNQINQMRGCATLSLIEQE